MGRILDPDWRQFEYVPAAKTDLRVSMERYKEKVFAENQRVRAGAEAARDDRRSNGSVPGEQDNGLQGAKLIALRGKG